MQFPEDLEDSPFNIIEDPINYILPKNLIHTGLSA